MQHVINKVFIKIEHLWLTLAAYFSIVLEVLDFFF